MSPHLLATVTTPIVTGFGDDGSVLPGATDGLLAHLAAAGIDSVMLLGSNGEGVAVETTEIGSYVHYVAARWRDLAGPHATVLVTVTAPSTRMMLARASAALEGGADAIVVSAPFYYRYTNAELLGHFQAADRLGAPWVAYNIPRYTGNPLTVDLVRQLAGLPQCVGVKDSGGDLELLTALAKLAGTRPGFAVSQGAERALAAGLRAGAAGITPGLANIAPAACRSLFDAVNHGDMDRAELIQQGLNELAAIHSIRSGIAATKAALRQLGLAELRLAAPFQPFDAAELATLRDVLASVPAGIL